jgi:hypothetical protein
MKMNDVSKLHFRCVDKGLFLPVALRLIREAGKVSYYSPHERDLESVCDQIGAGFPDLQRIDSPFDDKESVDCWVFPDVGFFGLQRELREQGFPVFGSGEGGRLETMRGKFLALLAQSGLSVPPHQRLEGISQLVDYVMDKEDLYIKISRYRKEGETFHWRSWSEDRDALYEMAMGLGPFAEQITFYVFDPIKTDIEDGIDTWFAADYPGLVLHGVEAKDRGFLGTWQRYDQVPEELRSVNEAIAPKLRELDYRGPLSTEVRIKDGESFFIDITTRFGSPPHQCQSEMIDNYAEMIWGVAQGEPVDPVPAYRFGLQVVLSTGRNREAWTYLKVDPQLRQWIKSSSAVYAQGLICGPPRNNPTGCEDWLVGVGDTIEAAVEHIQENSGRLPAGVSCDLSPIAELIQAVQAAEERGMPFTDEVVPEPEIVIE